MRILSQAGRVILWSSLLFGLTHNNLAAAASGTCQQPWAALTQQPADVSAQKIEGVWEGTLDAGVAKLRLILHVVRKDGALKASLDVPEQGATGLVIDTISVSAGAVRFEIKAFGAAYEGRLKSDYSEIEGEWKQAQTFPLVFKRAGQAGPTQSSLQLQKVNAGGHSLNLLAGGKRPGDHWPAVILEGGFGAGIASWTTVQAEIAKFAQVVSYDRAGLGQSEPGPKPRSAKQIALELHQALQAAGIKPPYVLVGHSFGGPYIRVFANMYPREVAGMVLIDPSQETFDDWMRNRSQQKLNESKSKNEEAQLAKAPQGVRDESAAVSATYEQVRSAKVPPGIPVILITAMQDPDMPIEVRRVWQQKHKEWIEKIPGGRHILAEKSRHPIQLDEPQLVIDAIKQVVEQVSHKPGAP
ncbi:MAG: alpha/beta fold hydrolase [Pyrinomonadaceae bacterium]